MNIIPDTVETKFHTFCMKCPLCEPKVDSRGVTLLIVCMIVRAQ